MVANMQGGNIPWGGPPKRRKLKIAAVASGCVLILGTLGDLTGLFSFFTGKQWPQIVAADSSTVPTPTSTGIVGSGSSPLPTTSAGPRYPTSTTDPPPVNAANGVPSAFVGTWSGSIVQTGSQNSPYPVQVTINGGTIGQTIGTADYPTLGCHGTWTLTETSPQRIVVDEQVDSSNCERVSVTLLLQTNGKIAYSFRSGIGSGLLSHPG